MWLVALMVLQPVLAKQAKRVAWADTYRDGSSFLVLCMMKGLGLILSTGKAKEEGMEERKGERKGRRRG